MHKWMCWHHKHSPTAPPQWETVPTQLPTHESPPLSNISSGGGSNHQGWCWLWAARKVGSGSNFWSAPLMPLICRKLGTVSEKMSWAPCLLIHLLPTWKEVNVLGAVLCLRTALQEPWVKAGVEHLLWFNSSSSQVLHRHSLPGVG